MFLFRVWYICVVVLALFGLPASAWNYCEENWCPRPSDHVACNNNGSLGPKCFPKARLIPLTNPLRLFILNKVNFYRNEVASGKFTGFGAARRMASVRWDPELAQLAELSAKRCSLSADTCRNTRRLKHVGQLTGHVIFNARRHSSLELLGHKIDNWFKEFKRIRDDKPNSFWQLMQERATHMGCGVLRQRRHGKWHEQFIVCNFARKDMVHEPAYEVDCHPASGCLAGVNPLYPNLCALEEHYDVNALDRFHTKKPSLKIKVLCSEPKQTKEVEKVPEKGGALEEHYDVNASDRFHPKKPSLKINILYSEPKAAKGGALEEHNDVNHTKKPSLEIKILYSEPKQAKKVASVPEKGSG